MNPKIKTFKIACYVNFFSILIFLGILFYDVPPKISTSFTNEDLLAFSILLLILVVYTGNFYYGLKLASCFNKEINSIKLNNKIRITFFILELLVGILYSIFIYYSIQQVKLSNIWPINADNILKLVVLVCLYTGYLSSLARMLLTRSVLRIIATKDKEIIEQLGKEAF